MLAVSLAVENAVALPFGEVLTPLAPLIPLVWSQARNVTAFVTVPLKSALGRK